MKSDENLNSAPSGQFRSSPFYIAITSLPASIFFAWLGTWACYLTLPQGAAEALAGQIQIACLGTGSVSTAAGVVGMVQRGLNLTDAKKQIAVATAKAALEPIIPDNVRKAINIGGHVILDSGVTAELPVADQPVFTDPVPCGPALESE